MKKLFLCIGAACALGYASSAQALPSGALPQPELEKKNFLLTSNIEDHALDRECDWIWGKADTADWANPGHQYQTEV